MASIPNCEIELPISAPGPSRRSEPFWRAIALTLISGVLYFSLAYAALMLQKGVAGIAIFWPAAGISAGLMMALGAPSYGPVAVGTIAATLAANTIFNRSPPLALAFGILNAGEAVIIAWVLTRLPRQFEISSKLMEALLFFAVAAVSSGIAAAGAAVILKGGTGTQAPWFEICRVWLLSDMIGVVVVAPLIVSCVMLARSPPHLHDWSFDILLLIMFTGTAWHGLSTRLDANTWIALAPGTTLLPIIIWLAARAQPVVPAIGVVVLAALMAVFAATGQGRFGDPSIPMHTRMSAAQATLAAVALVALLVSALFDERRSAESRIRAHERRQTLTASAVPGVMFSLRREDDGRLYFPYLSAKASAVLGHTPDVLGTGAEPFLNRLALECRQALLSALDQPDGKEDPIRVELSCPGPGDQTIWLELSAAPAKEANGRTVWHGFLQDVTSRHVLVQELNHRTRNILTVVQSVAQHTADNADPKDFAGNCSPLCVGVTRA